MDRQVLNGWLLNTGPSVDWRSVEEQQYVLPIHVQVIRDKITRCSAAVTAFESDIDLPALEAEQLQGVLAERLNQCNLLLDESPCRRHTVRTCVSPVIVEAFQQIRSAGRQLELYRQIGLSDEESPEVKMQSVFTDVCSAIMLYHEVIHRYLQAPTKE